MITNWVLTWFLALDDNEREHFCVNRRMSASNRRTKRIEKWVNRFFMTHQFPRTIHKFVLSHLSAPWQQQSKSRRNSNRRCGLFPVYWFRPFYAAWNIDLWFRTLANLHQNKFTAIWLTVSIRQTDKTSDSIISCFGYIFAFHLKSHTCMNIQYPTTYIHN